MLQVEIWLLALIPARLIIDPLGAMGTPASLWAVGLFGAWAISVLTPGLGVSRTCVPVRVALAVFGATTLVSYGLMHRRAVPTVEVNSSDNYLILLLAFSGVALVGAEGLRTSADVLRVLRTSVSATAVIALIALLQFRADIDLTKYATKLPVLTENGNLEGVLARASFNRPAGTASHPIELGVVVAASLAFAIHLYLYDRQRRSSLRFLCLALIGLAVPASISRSALLVAATVLAFFVAGTTARVRLQALCALPVVAVVMFITTPGFVGTLTRLVLGAGSDESITTRTGDYAAASRYIRQSPWIGRGGGTFLPSYRLLDNQYLLTLIELGVVGLASLLLLLTVTFFLGRGTRLRARSEADRDLGQMFAAVGACAAISSVTYDALSFPMFTAFTALYMGLAGATWAITRAETRTNERATERGAGRATERGVGRATERARHATGTTRSARPGAGTAGRVTT